MSIFLRFISTRPVLGVALQPHVTDVCYGRPLLQAWLLPDRNSISKGLVTPANGFVTEEKRIKHAEFGYPVTKFISSDARDSRDRFVERLSHIMTVHQTGVSIRFIRWKVLNMFKT